MNNHRKTKIIATLGPKTSSEEAVKELIIHGVNTFRLNFSHGTHEQIKNLIDIINKTKKDLNKSVSILADLQGPKIRTGETPGNQQILLKHGKDVYLTSKAVICSSDLIHVSYKHLVKDVKKNERILINDGLIALKVIEIDVLNNQIKCKVENSGFYSSHKGVNFPDSTLSVPALTKKDENDLKFILTQKIDYIALSFVRKADDLKKLISLIPKSNNLRIIAKIEKPEAIDNIADIIDNSDGIMVARGDLGVETSIAKVPLIQKDLINYAIVKAKTVIVATQMLESMIHHYLPTRAESTDITNAILDGADALMLSGETAVGDYPYMSVQMMSDIIMETEHSPHYPKSIIDLDFNSHSASQAICDAAAYASKDLNDCPVLVFTLSGQTAWYLSNTRIQGSIFAFSPDKIVVSQLALAWNTNSFKVTKRKDMMSLINEAERCLVDNGFAYNNDMVIIISGALIIPGSTNNLRIKRIGKN